MRAVDPHILSQQLRNVKLESLSISIQGSPTNLSSCIEHDRRGEKNLKRQHKNYGIYTTQFINFNQLSNVNVEYAFAIFKLTVSTMA